MRRLLLIALPALVATSLTAQLTPEQRRAREFEAVRYTIGETRQLEAERRQENYPLRGATCGAAYVSENGCGAAFRQQWTGSHSLLAAMAAAGGILARDHWVAFGVGAQSDRHLRTPGNRKITLAVENEETITLATPIGAKGVGLMISTAVRDTAGGAVWSRMGEIAGNDKGRYLIPLPRLSTGNYLLEIAVYDPNVPEEPYSRSLNPLAVR